MSSHDPNLIEKFFGFFQEKDGGWYRYGGDTVADPMTDPRAIAWMVTAPILAFITYRYYYTHKDKARKAAVVLSVILLFLRLYTHGSQVIWGRSPALTFLPFHLCEIMCIVMPIVVLTNAKWFKVPIYALTLMGAVTTIYLGDQFIYTFFNSGLAVSIISHTLLLIIPLIEHAGGEYRFDIKESLKLFPIMLLLMGWAQLANKVFLAGKNYNYMFLNANGLPNNIGGKYYFLIYIAIFFFMYFTIFIPPLIRNKRKTKLLQSAT